MIAFQKYSNVGRFPKCALPAMVQANRGRGDIRYPARRMVMGKLAAKEFLSVLTDVTTWSLTHFEPVRSWSVAEDLTPTEEQEGYGLIGRVRRMSASEYGGSRITRTLRDVSNPKVRAAAT
jgi:hypothetical protein